MRLGPQCFKKPGPVWELRQPHRPFFTLSTDFRILADVSIFYTGLDWLFLLINWTKRNPFKDKAI